MRIQRMKVWMGRMFSVLFLCVSMLLVGLSGYQFFNGLAAGKEIIAVFVQAINTAIVSLALFELGIGIGKEYAAHEEDDAPYFLVRRTITRFVGTVCIALVLESLIMIIKYSQLDLAGNLYYPVGIMAGAAFLLVGLGVFLHLTRADSEGGELGHHSPLLQVHHGGREASGRREKSSRLTA